MKRPRTIQEALKRCKSKMSAEEAARQNAENPPFEPETNPRKKSRIMRLPFALPEENSTKEE